MLALEAVECRYGKVQAVRSLSIEVRQGELVTLIGANGAGKTTTLKAISGIVKPTAGKIQFEGRDIDGSSPRDILAAGIAHCPKREHVATSTWALAL